MVTLDNLRSAVARDYLNVVPVLALLYAIDAGFPRGGPLLNYMWMSGDWLQIDFAKMARSLGCTPSTQALIRCAHDVWNGDVKTPLNQVLHRCDARRVDLLLLALHSSAERGRGPASDKILALVGLE